MCFLPETALGCSFACFSEQLGSLHRAFHNLGVGAPFTGSMGLFWSVFSCVVDPPFAASSRLHQICFVALFGTLRRQAQPLSGKELGLGLVHYRVQDAHAFGFVARIVGGFLPRLMYLSGIFINLVFLCVCSSTAHFQRYLSSILRPEGCLLPRA